MEDSLPFKIGDRVEVIKNRTESYPRLGKIGTIVNLTAHSSPMYAVQFEGEAYPDGIGICMNKSELRKINLNG